MGLAFNFPLRLDKDEEGFSRRLMEDLGRDKETEEGPTEEEEVDHQAWLQVFALKAGAIFHV